MIHVPGKHVTLEELRWVPLVRPDNAGTHWQGVQHGAFVDRLLDKVAARGWRVDHMAFALARDGADIAGAFDIDLGSGQAAPDGLHYSLGFVGSNARRKAWRLVAGARVLVCNNGLVTGQVVLDKKHTVRTDLDLEFDKALDGFQVAALGTSTLVATLRGRRLHTWEATMLLDAAKDAGYMPKSRLWDVLREFVVPSHREHGRGTAWTLLNAFTEVVKQNPPVDQMGQIDGFRRLLLGDVAA